LGFGGWGCGGERGRSGRQSNCWWCFGQQPGQMRSELQKRTAEANCRQHAPLHCRSHLIAMEARAGLLRVTPGGSSGGDCSIRACEQSHTTLHPLAAARQLRWNNMLVLPLFAGRGVWCVCSAQADDYSCSSSAPGTLHRPPRFLNDEHPSPAWHSAEQTSCRLCTWGGQGIDLCLQLRLVWRGEQITD